MVYVFYAGIAMHVKLGKTAKSACPRAARNLNSLLLQKFSASVSLATSGHAFFCCVHPAAAESVPNMF